MSESLQRFFRGVAKVLGTQRGLARVARMLGGFAAFRYARARMQNGGTLVFDLADPGCFPLFLNGTIAHEQAEIALLGSLLRPGDVFVDVGANVGFYVTEALLRVGPEGRIVAFEPTPSCADLLRRSFADVPNVTIVEAAAFDRSGQTEFHVSAVTALSSLADLDPTARTVPVRLTTLDEEFANHRWPPPSVLKIDVEGAELAVLRGARGLLASGKLRAVLFEYADNLASQFGFTLDDIRDELGPAFTLHRIGEQNDWVAATDTSFGTSGIGR